MLRRCPRLQAVCPALSRRQSPKILPRESRVHGPSPRAKSAMMPLPTSVPLTSVKFVRGQWEEDRLDHSSPAVRRTTYPHGSGTKTRSCDHGPTVRKMATAGQKCFGQKAARDLAHGRRDIHARSSRSNGRRLPFGRLTRLRSPTLTKVRTAVGQMIPQHPLLGGTVCFCRCGWRQCVRPKGPHASQISHGPRSRLILGESAA